jgi:hypothetical protein
MSCAVALKKPMAEKRDRDRFQRARHFLQLHGSLLEKYALPATMNIP